MNARDRRAGRALRRARRSGHPAPRLAMEATILTETFRSLRRRLDDLTHQFDTLAASPRSERPLIHNGRKYPR